MFKIRLGVLALAGACVVSVRAQYADAVIAYTPGVGVRTSYTNAAVALGEPSRVNPFGEAVDPFDPPYGTNQIVSVGAGGSLIVRLDTPAVNDPAHPFGVDFLIFAHAGFAITNGDYSGGGITDGSLFDNNPGATRVSVSSDGVTFYPLNPALAPTVDGWFPTDGSGDFTLPVNPALAGRDFAGKDLAGIRALYAGSGGGAGFALAWAQDTNSQSVFLPAVRYVRVDVLGGKSEIDGFSVVSARPTFQEDFTGNPAPDGWQVFGDTNLFQWDATNRNLRVTWDSAQSNSYYYHPLGTVLTRQDDFSATFDLFLNDAAAGVSANKPSSFPLTLGFLDLDAATNTNFLRGTGTNSPDLVEFAYFPDAGDGFGPTLWPDAWSTNSSLDYNGPGDYLPLALPVGVTMHVTMRYTASNQTLATTITTNGLPFVPVDDVKLNTNFTDFRVDTFAIESYNDAGQDPQFGGSLRAHGTMDNLQITVHPSPVQSLRGHFANGGRQVEFTSRTNWNYTLEATSDLQIWAPVSTTQAGTGGSLILSDTNSVPASRRFYRLRADRP
ncbi:MAG: hypothetical protein ACYDH9_06525 [Limisphaerales bacterium]